MARQHTRFFLRLPVVILLFLSSLSIASARKKTDADPPEVALGERLFIETRFAQAFKVFLGAGGVVNGAGANDPVMNNTVKALGAPLAGPFAGQSMNCRACHLVDEHVDTPGGGMSTYNDFARRTPIPARPEDTKTTTPRNSPPLVNASLERNNGLQFHFDAEFVSLEDLVAGAFTGRNFGWRPGEANQAIAQVARIIREDDGTGELAQEFGGLSYAQVLTGTGPIPQEFRLPTSFRVHVKNASDAEIFAAVNKLVAAYTRQLEFSRGPDGNFNLSPYDVFLNVNGLPKAPNKNESAIDYSRRLLGRINQLDSQGKLKFVTSNPATQDGQFKFHSQSFQFTQAELDGLRMFFHEPQALPASTGELAAGRIGNCLACHAAPNFTDFRFHNTGTAQSEYDSVHSAGSFATLIVPDLATRNANPNSYLPATGLHPNAAEPFRSVPHSADFSLTDLGVWNIFANPDFPKPQSNLTQILCQQLTGTVPDCAPATLLPKTIAIFKTPGLRDLSHSAPYMHTGQFDTLDQIVQFYVDSANKGRAGTLRNGARELTGIALQPADAANLVAFLRALNEDYE